MKCVYSPAAAAAANEATSISMADTFNLTWKLAHVIQGRADPSILRTYHSERSQVAADLIEFDHKASRCG